MKTAEEILADAAALVERPGGWCQHRMYGGGAFCAVGALNEAAGPECESYESAVTALARELRGGFVGSMSLLIAHWNDDPSRTAEEVAATMRNAKRWL